MIRFVLVAIVWLAFVGGVTGYLRVRDAWREPASAHLEPAPEKAAARYDLELTLTFHPEPDPFALTGGASGPPPPVSIRVNGSVVAEPDKCIEPNTPWLKQGIERVVVGTNELFVEASPPLGEARVRYAARVRVLEGGRVVADETFWSEGGAKVTGVLRFEIAPQESEIAHAR